MMQGLSVFRSMFLMSIGSSDIIRFTTVLYRILIRNKNVLFTHSKQNAFYSENCLKKQLTSPNDVKLVRACNEVIFLSKVILQKFRGNFNRKHFTPDTFKRDLFTYKRIKAESQPLHNYDLVTKINAFINFLNE